MTFDPRTWHLDRPQIILTAFSMFRGQFGTRICPVNEASMNLMFMLGGLVDFLVDFRVFCFRAVWLYGFCAYMLFFSFAFFP